MRFEKGSIILCNGIWYVVVRMFAGDNGTMRFYCICDHANNIHSFDVDEVEFTVTPYEVVNARNYGIYPSDEIRGALHMREAPEDVILEVLAGLHDHRFDHWGEKHE